MGAYHTIDLEVNRKFTLSKPEWDSIALERVDQACDPTQVTKIFNNMTLYLCYFFQHAEIAAIVMQEGLANICLVTSSMTIVRAKIEVSIPRKRKGHAQQHEKVN